MKKKMYITIDKKSVLKVSKYIYNVKKEDWWFGYF